MLDLVRKLLSNKFISAGLRIAGLLALVYIAISFADIQRIWQNLRTVSLTTLIAMTGFHLIIISLTSWRFAAIARSFGADINSAESHKLTFYSTLGNLLLPTSLAGDAGRVWLVRKYGLDLKGAFSVGVFDRLIGLASLSLIVLLGAVGEQEIVSLPLALGICAVCSGLAIWAFTRQRLFGKANEKPTPASDQPYRVLALSVVLSATGHTISVVITYLYFNDQSISVSMSQLMVLFPAVLLAASIPVSIGGWGTRELSAIAAFSTIGLSAPVAVAMSLLFGLTQLAAAGLGSIYYGVRGRI